MKKEHFRRQVNLACQGLITRNNNAFELAHHFIPQGNLLFSRLQRYASFLSKVEQETRGSFCHAQGQGQAAQFLVYLLPFLMAFGATEQRIEEYSTVSISLIAGVEKFLNAGRSAIPCFLISSAYKPFVQSLGHLLGFRESEVYYTPLNVVSVPDQCSINESEREILKDLSDEIIDMPLLSWEKNAPQRQGGLPLTCALSGKASCSHCQGREEDVRDHVNRSDSPHKEIIPDSPLKEVIEVIPEHIPYRQRLEIIFGEEIAGMQAGKILTQVTALAGDEKVKAVIDSLGKTGNPAEGVLYFGCSVLDAAALDWVKKAGGMAISFNGDRAAVRSSEVAVMSGTSVILAILSDTFFQQGKEGVLELVKNWDLHKIQTEKLKIHPSLMHELFSHEHESFPLLELVESSNLERLIGERQGAKPSKPMS